MPFNWTCPCCDTKTTIYERINFLVSEQKLTIDNSEGPRLLRNEWIVCPNTECKRIFLSATLYELLENDFQLDYQIGETLKTWKLLPNSYAKSFPEYIPKALRNDYEESALILDLSPKASATLSRRCLQGIIRDFWNINKSSLFAEINAIEGNVDPLTWKSIDAVRKVGNIGAHMEKDINLIIDVEPKEALLLLQLIELLFEEWYIHRFERERKLNSIIELAETKDKEKNVQKIPGKADNL